MKKILMATATLLLITSCGGGGSSSKVIKPMDALERTIAFQQYMITATPEKTSFPFNMCSVIKGFMLISNNSATGTIFTLTNKPYVISGTYLPETGGIDGLFTGSDNNIAPFSGIFNSEQGSGTWSDDFNCKGKWVAFKKNE